jgi:hypothetical protein
LPKDRPVSEVRSVGTEGNELADRVAMRGVQRKEGTAAVRRKGYSDAAQDAGGVITSKSSD